MDYDDAIVDADTYFHWLCASQNLETLQDMTKHVMDGAGLTVHDDFRDLWVGDTAEVLLAHFIAHNSDSSVNEMYMAHCRRHYPRPNHPALTVVERNAGPGGAR